MREQLLGIWTGTCHSNFPAGRRIKRSLSHPPGTSIGTEPKFWTCVQLTKNELKNGAQGHCNSQTGRVIKENYRPKNLLSEGSEGNFNERHNSRKQISRGTLESPLKHRKRGTSSTMTHLAKKGISVFSLIYSGENAYALFGQASKRAMQICTTKNYHIKPVKRDIHKMCKNQKGKTGPGEQGALLF